MFDPDTQAKIAQKQDFFNELYELRKKHGVLDIYPFVDGCNELFVKIDFKDGMEIIVNNLEELL